MKIRELFETGSMGAAITSSANVSIGTPMYPNTKVKTSAAKGNNLLTGGSIVKRAPTKKKK
jgi:hypothetical protein